MAGFIKTQSPKFLIKKKKNAVVTLLQLLDDLDDLIFAAAIAVLPWLTPDTGKAIGRAFVMVLLAALPLSAFALFA